MRETGGVEGDMQPFKIIPNPCCGIDKNGRAELVSQRLHEAGLNPLLLRQSEIRDR